MAYYGFKKSTEIDKSVIDWAGVTGKISEGLMSVKKDRDKQRNDIEDRQIEQLKELSDYDTGVVEDMNTFVMNQSQSTRDFLISIHKQMKDGVISVDQAKRIKQSVSNTWDSVSTSTKTFNQRAKELSEKKGKGNEALLELMSKNAQLDGKQIYHDPITGEGYYVDVDKKTGKIDMKTAKSVKSINNLQNKSFEYVDVDAETTEIAKNAPTIQLSPNSVTTVKDALQSKNFVKYLDRVVDSKLSDDGRMLSVGLDYLNLEYDVSGSGESQSSTITYNRVVSFDTDGTPKFESTTKEIGDIKMDPRTGKPSFTTEQRGLMKDAYKNAVMGKLDRVEAKKYVAKTKDSASGRARKQDDSSLYALSMGVASGDKQSLKSLEGQTYTTANSDGKPIKYVLGTPVVTDRYIEIKDSEGNSLSVISKLNDAEEPLPEDEVALQIAPFIRSGEASDKIKSAFDRGRNVYGEYIQEGDKAEVKETETTLQSLPEDEDDAADFLTKAFKGDDRISFSNKWFDGVDFIKIKIKTESGSDNKELKTTDIAGIEKFLRQYNIKIPRQIKEKAYATKKNTSTSDGIDYGTK